MSCLTSSFTVTLVTISTKGLLWACSFAGHSTSFVIFWRSLPVTDMGFGMCVGSSPGCFYNYFIYVPVLLNICFLKCVQRQQISTHWPDQKSIAYIVTKKSIIVEYRIFSTLKNDFCLFVSLCAGYCDAIVDFQFQRSWCSVSKDVQVITSDPSVEYEVQSSRRPKMPVCGEGGIILESTVDMKCGSKFTLQGDCRVSPRIRHRHLPRLEKCLFWNNGI